MCIILRILKKRYIEIPHFVRITSNHQTTKVTRAEDFTTYNNIILT